MYPPRFNKASLKLPLFLHFMVQGCINAQAAVIQSLSLLKNACDLSDGFPHPSMLCHFIHSKERIEVGKV